MLRTRINQGPGVLVLTTFFLGARKLKISPICFGKGLENTYIPVYRFNIFYIEERVESWGILSLSTMNDNKP